MANTRDGYKDQCGGTMMHAPDPEEGIAGIEIQSHSRALTHAYAVCAAIILRIDPNQSGSDIEKSNAEGLTGDFFMLYSY